MSEPKLTDKQKCFVDEYLKDLNKKQAAIRANYSEKTADRIACETLQKPHVQAYLEKRRADLQRRTEVTQDKVINELAKIAFANGADFAQIVMQDVDKPKYNAKGLLTGIKTVKVSTVKLFETEALDEDKKAAISCIKEGKFGIEVSSYDKLRALELLGKYLGIFNDGASAAPPAENNLLDVIRQAAADINCSAEVHEDEV